MPHKDPEVAKAYHAARRAERREEAKAISAQWRRDNPGRNNESAKRWREANPERVKESHAAYRERNKERIREKQREWRKKVGYNELRKARGENQRQQLRSYGLTQECFDRLLAEQGGGCAICARTDAGMKNASRLYVDHCHATGAVRGLLCRACNTMLGCVKDNPGMLLAGVSYLERSRGSGPIR